VAVVIVHAPRARRTLHPSACLSLSLSPTCAQACQLRSVWCSQAVHWKYSNLRAGNESEPCRYAVPDWFVSQLSPDDVSLCPWRKSIALSTRCLHRQFAWKVPLQGWPYCPEIYRSYGKHDSADDSAALWQLTEGLAIKNVTLRGHFLFNNINLPQVQLHAPPFTIHSLSRWYQASLATPTVTPFADTCRATRRSTCVTQVINEMAAQTAMLNQDRCTKNYYVFKQPSTGEWHMFPWDNEDAFGKCPRISVRARVTRSVHCLPFSFGLTLKSHTGTACSVRQARRCATVQPSSVRR